MNDNKNNNEIKVNNIEEKNEQITDNQEKTKKFNEDNNKVVESDTLEQILDDTSIVYDNNLNLNTDKEEEIEDKIYNSLKNSIKEENIDEVLNSKI